MCHDIRYTLLETGAYPTRNLLSFDCFELSLQKYVGWFGIFDLLEEICVAKKLYHPSG